MGRVVLLAASEVDVAAIESFDDEYQYWLSVAKSNSEDHEGTRAEAFASHFGADRNGIRCDSQSQHPPATTHTQSTARVNSSSISHPQEPIGGHNRTGAD